MLKRVFSPYVNLNKNIYLIGVARFINALGTLIFPFITLILKEKIGLSEGRVGLYLAIGGLVFVPASIIGGKLSDKFGRKKIIFIGDFLVIVFYSICFFMPVNMTMIWLLFIASFFGGIIMPSYDAMVSDIATEEERARSYSFLYYMFNLGFAFAMFLGGKLFNNYLHYMFLIDAITALLALIIVMVFVEDVYRTNIISKVENEDKLKESILSILNKNRIVVLFSFSMIGLSLLFSQWNFLVPIQSVDYFGDEKGSIIYGNIGVINGITVVIFTTFVTKFFKDIREIINIILALVIAMIGFSLFAYTESSYAFYLGTFLFTIGEILETISVLPFIMKYTPETHRGRMAGVFPVIMGIGFLAGPVLSGQLKEQYSYTFTWQVFLIAAALSIVLLFVVLLLDKKRDLTNE